MNDRELNTALLWIVGMLGMYFWGAALLLSFGWQEGAGKVGLSLTMLALLSLLPLTLLAIWQLRASGFGFLAASMLGLCGSVSCVRTLSGGTWVFLVCVLIFVGWTGWRLRMPAM